MKYITPLHILINLSGIKGCSHLVSAGTEKDKRKDINTMISNIITHLNISDVLLKAEKLY